MLTKTVLNSLYFSGLDLFSTSVFGKPGGIWMLHRVCNQASKAFDPNAHLAVSPEFLDSAIFRFKQRGYRFVSLDHLVDVLKSDEANVERLIAVTLDDGYRDNLLNAVPVFARHEVPYTIYVAPGMVEGTHTLWWEDLEHVVAANRKIAVRINGEAVNLDTETPHEKRKVFADLVRMLTEVLAEDEQREFIDRLCRVHGHDATGYVRSQIMGWDELKSISASEAGTIGAHTVGHYAIARVSEARAREEMKQGRAILENRLGQSVDHFAFPYGGDLAVSERDVRMAGELGFKSAVTTQYGVLEHNKMPNLHALPRVSVNGHYQSVRYLRPLMSSVPGKLYSLAGKRQAA